MTTLAITGAAGTVGTALRPELRRRGYGLRLLDVQAAADPVAGEQAVLADIRDQTAMTQAFAGADAILHLAACTTDADWPAQVSLSIEGTISVFEAARAAGVKRIIYASSHHVVGFHPRDRKPGRDAMLLPDSRYGVGKAFGESIGALYAAKYGFSVLCIRIGNVNTRPIDRRRLGNWISARDLAQLVAIGVEKDDLVFDVVYGISDATGRHYDNASARALGYRPQDASEPFESQVLAEDPPPATEAAARSAAEATLGGQFSAGEFEGDPMRLQRIWR
jgi:uronate dehydrogenase